MRAIGRTFVIAGIFTLGYFLGAWFAWSDAQLLVEEAYRSHVVVTVKPAGVCI